jgi:hypothetical protein
MAKRLKEAGFTEPQAEAVTTVLRDAREADFSLLSTKADLNALRDATKADLNALRDATRRIATGVTPSLRPFGKRSMRSSKSCAAT